jgi:DNA (cytosine-5)-methyltransferase 1
MRAISLFSGCGGDSLGLERAGYQVVAFNEFKKAAIETHEANFPESTLLKHNNCSDITKVPDSVFEPYKDTVDIVFAGFPCQGFSHAGKKKESDPRNQMYQQFVRVAKVVQPSFIIGENVTGLLKMKSGPAADDPLVLTLIEQAFDAIGYSITYKILEADKFGVPQKRKRLLIVGWNRVKVNSFNTDHFWNSVEAWGKAQNAKKLKTFIQPSLEGAFQLQEQAVPEGFDSHAVYVLPTQTPSGTPHPYVTLKASTFNTDYRGKALERLLSCGKRDSPLHSEIVSLVKPCKTIICTYDHQPRLLAGLKKHTGEKYVRALLPDELKQIQGFPESFMLKGSLKEKIVQIGNAVPPALVEAVARHLKTQ